VKKQPLRQKEIEDVFQTPEFETHIFRASDVTRILGIEKWRLEKFLTGKQFRLSPSGHIGEGKGSWRLFNHQDLYRLAIATWLVEDGFTAKFASLMLQEIEDSELLDFDENGESRAQTVGVVRSESGPRVVWAAPPGTQRPYYVLPLGLLIKNVDKQIRERR
jgi:hypothetical protein